MRAAEDYCPAPLPRLYSIRIEPVPVSQQAVFVQEVLPVILIFSQGYTCITKICASHYLFAEQVQLNRRSLFSKYGALAVRQRWV